MLQAKKHRFFLVQESNVRHRGKTYMEALLEEESAMTETTPEGFEQHGEPPSA